MTFLSDQDGRPAGGAHPYTHLWDNGKDAADELHRIMDVRSVVLKNFGERNIRAGAPMATLEEVLVPMYFLHRYQVEAASKVVGGLNYRYALRGDGQPVTAFVDPAVQEKALKELLATVTAESLQLPESLLKNIPPRPLGYVRHRELAKIRTELTFDPISLAETAADLTYSMLLHPARINRLVEYHGRDSKQPGAVSVIDRIITHSFKSATLTGHAGHLQMAGAAAALMNLAALAADNDASPVARGIAMGKLSELRTWLSAGLGSQKDADRKGFHTWCISMIDRFQEDPSEFKVERALPAPPGQPIGQEDWWCPVR